MVNEFKQPAGLSRHITVSIITQDEY